jgi:hypothetical protein
MLGFISREILLAAVFTLASTRFMTCRLQIPLLEHYAGDEHLALPFQEIYVGHSNDLYVTIITFSFAQLFCLLCFPASTI